VRVNASPHKARLGKRLRHKPGNLADVQKILWYSLKLAQGVLDNATEEDQILRGVHAVSQCAGQYAKLLEIGEFEARLAAIEATLAGRSG
jgi:hypothetical protein